MYCVKSPFTLIVIPGLTRNPVFASGFPLEFIPYLIRGWNDGFGINVKKRLTHYTNELFAHRQDALVPRGYLNLNLNLVL